MRSPMKLLNLLIVVAALVAACGGAPTPTVAPTAPAATLVPTEAATASPTTAAEGDILYLNLMWHQHQPLYYKDADGVYTRPWVRVHGTKDYYDMAATVAKYPKVHVTFNLTPVLLKQLNDYVANGAKDKYWVLTEKPAADLTDDDKDFILRHFFDANWDHVIKIHPGYKALLDKRAGTDAAAIAAAKQNFTEQDFRDLQVWFNLAWMDPDVLAVDPLKPLIEKDHGFAEADKAVIFAEVRRILAEIVPIHKQLQDAGQIEVTTTPYAHPILPLINDTTTAGTGNPKAEMPQRFNYPADVQAQLARSVDIYQQTFGRSVRGLWPGEGAVAQTIVSAVAQAGYQWMASGEPVLAKSIGLGQFTRDAKDTVQQADQLYRPYVVEGINGGSVSIVFRDLTLSDKIGFTYSGTEGKAAAADFMQRLENIRAELKKEGATGPHLVSVILDGENAWENYSNDGKDFLNALYQALSDSATIQTITPSEYLTKFPEQKKITFLFPGAWFTANYDTWIGEAEETKAWNYLAKVRSDLGQYDISHTKTAPSPEALAQAQDYMYLAEGSDWFWWYGTDQDSGDDGYFDQGYRALLANVYKSLGEPAPAFVNIPIIPARTVAPDQLMGGIFTPQIDGVAGADEWALAAHHSAAGGVQARAEDLASGLYYGVDAKNLYVRVDAKTDWASLKDATVGVYILAPRFTDSIATSRLSTGAASPTLLGFGATTLAEVQMVNGGFNGLLFNASGINWAAAGPLPSVAAKGSVLEFAMPLAALGDLEPGDDLRLVVVVSQGQRDLQMLPAGGPSQLIIPDLGTLNIVLSVDDPRGDDNGPGAYTYPGDAVFTPGVFDLKNFTVGTDDKSVVFKFGFYGAVPNPWGSPSNLALQTLDVYVDKDPGKKTGGRMLLPGRNASLPADSGWEFAVWAEGWTPQFVAPDPATGEPKQLTDVSFKIIVNQANSSVTIRVPKEAFGAGDPATWGYVAAVMSQEGYPSAGVWRVRDGQEKSAQWKFGGVPAGATNYPRILDLADTGDRAAQLAFKVSTADVATLAPDDFAQVSLLLAK